jgi:hypothetical protein
MGTNKRSKITNKEVRERFENILEIKHSSPNKHVLEANSTIPKNY